MSKAGSLVWFKTVDSQKHWVDFINNYNKPVKRNKRWVDNSLTVFATNESSEIIVGVSVYKKGHLWLKDVKLEQVRQEECVLPISKLSLIDTVMKIVAMNSINKSSVNLENVYNNAVSIAKDGCDKSSVEHAIDYIINRLKDKHSFYLAPEIAAKWRKRNIALDDRSPVPVLNKLYRLLQNERVEIKEFDGYAYIKVPPLATADQDKLTSYAASLQADILSHNSAKGWIIDLTDNTGGNYWPMLAGLGPLLNDGICGFFVDGDGRSKTVSYNSGVAMLDNDTIIKISTPTKLAGKPPIAILIGDKTSSSGEMLAVSFKGMSDVRFFGNSTSGLCSGNASFRLPDDSELFITTSVFADRTGYRYLANVSPDVWVADEDKAKEEAINWLKGLDITK